MLEQEPLGTMGEGCRVSWHPVVGAGPRGEVQRSRLAWHPAPDEIVDQRRDGAGGQRPPEELRFAVDRTGLRWGLARGVAFHLIAEVDQVSLDVPVGRVHMIGRRGILAGAGD